MNLARILATLLCATILGLSASAAPFGLEVDGTGQRYRVTCTATGPAARYDGGLLEEQFGLPNGASVQLRDAGGGTVVEQYSPVMFSGRGFEPSRYRTADSAGPLTRWFDVGSLFTGLETRGHPKLHTATTFRLTVAVSDRVALQSEWLPLPDAVQRRFQRQAAEVVIEHGGTGPYPAIATEDASLPGMTIFRPRELNVFGGERKLPVLLWGNGACANTTQEHKNFLNELASHGYLVLAIGLLDQIEERNDTSRRPTNSGQLLAALDWIQARNESAGDAFSGKVDLTKVAAMGMSCGGLQAIEISGDPRITTTVVCNSGVLPSPSPLKGMPALAKDVLLKFHGPVLYIMGGPTDIAYANAMDDFARVNHVPIVMTNHDVGHGGTYAQPHGGEFTKVALPWLDWQLKGRTEASRLFLGEPSGLSQDPKWTIQVKNFPAK